MRVRITVLLAGALLAPTAAFGQVAWDAPMLVSPSPQPGFGIYIVDSHGGSTGVQGMWRSVVAEQSLGVRFGFARGRYDRPRDGELSAFGGLDFGGRFHDASEEFPLDVAWLVGAGVGFGRWAWASFPAGVSLGHTFDLDTATAAPYFGPRFVVDATFGRTNELGEDLDRMDLRWALEMGVEFRFMPSWGVNFGATLGSRSAIALGMVF